MLKNKEIERKFGIAAKTLYNWSESRPALYEFLKKSDEMYSKNRDLNIIMKVYEQHFIPIFSKAEVKFLLNLEYKARATDYFENFQEKFLEISKHKLQEQENQKLIVSILGKLSKLSLIETYILLDKIAIFKEKIAIKDFDSKEYFKHIFESVCI